MKKINGTNIAEFIAIFLSILILIGFAIIPQHFSDKALRKIISQTESAISDITEAEKLITIMESIKAELNKAEKLFHFIYPHADVTELEVAISAAYETVRALPTEEGEILTELCRIKSAAEVLMETDRVTLGSIL